MAGDQRGGFTRNPRRGVGNAASVLPQADPGLLDSGNRREQGLTAV